MNARNLTSKIIAASLILSFLWVGAVPAKNDCTGSCPCCAKTKHHFQDSLFLPFESHEAHLHAAISGTHHQTSSDELLLSIYFPDRSCHQAGIVSATCHMEPFRPLEVLQSGSSLPWSERSMLKAITSVLTEKSSIDSPFYRPTFSYSMNVKTISNPLYLQNLSLLC
jgi:hypothetical protein